MGTILSLLWKLIASVGAALGIAVVARTYTEAPRKGLVTSGARPDGKRAGAAEEGAPAGQPAAALRPGWSRPKPEIIPRSTYWPIIFGGGITLIFWGLVSNIFVFGFGLILLIVGISGWIGDMLNE